MFWLLLLYFVRSLRMTKKKRGGRVFSLLTSPNFQQFTLQHIMCILRTGSGNIYVFVVVAVVVVVVVVVVFIIKNCVIRHDVLMQIP